MVTPTVASMPTAAMPMPYSPANQNDAKMATQMRITGMAVDSMPTARPAMMLVAAPVWLASAILRTGPAAV